MLIQSWLQDTKSWFTQQRRVTRKRRHCVVVASEVQVLDSRVVLTAKPVAPTGFTAKATASDEVELAWKDVKNEKGYRIYMNDGSGWEAVDSVKANSKAYTVTDLEGDTKYAFYIESFNSAGAKKSRTVSVTTPIAAPEAPKDLTADAKSATEVELSWEDTDKEEGYSIYQFVGSKWKLIGKVDADETSHTVTHLDPDTEYRFYVEAFNSGGANQTDEVTATTTVDGLSAPTGLTAGATSDSEVKLSWQDTDNEDGYAIYQLVGGKWKLIDETAADETSIVVSHLAPASKYTFYVAAHNSQSEEASEQVSVTTTNKNKYIIEPIEPKRNQTQGSFTAKAESDSSVRLSWERDAKATGYEITIAIGTSVWPVANVGPEETTYVVPGVFQDLPIEYVFQLITHDKSGGVTTQTVRFGGDSGTNPNPKVPDPGFPGGPDLGIPGGGFDGPGNGNLGNPSDHDPFFQSIGPSDFM